ncbi:glycosyltransferase [Pseudonocardia broussonetiae]|uniref:Glycosyltransferase family 1 protein n=1 Tax=Pseudonocardia broussonetiae TaxID=2736640 RepID=A0A6M6JF34_9PSEU|nr:glycosyltransferase [Pseudonocardia broussonetiae]QJY46588.1 glycosyltransferase family 1 protein [Pseudonocardia broussonetiae]
MRVLITACPLYGHVNTVLPLALAARRAGHETVVATGGARVPHVARRGLVTWAVGPDRLAASPEGWLAQFVASARPRADDLVARALRWRPDLVIGEETELAAGVVAAATGARHAVHGLGLMPPQPIRDALAPALDALGARHGVDDAAERVWRAEYLEIAPPALRPPGPRSWPHARPLRPATGDATAGDRLPAALERLPHADTVHLTLGTVFHGASDVLAAALDGLLRLPVNVVVTTGPGTDPSVLGPQPPQVLARPYLPHALLLPRCRLVVSQGGAGILLGAAAHGLPQLVLPQGADQPGNAAALAGAGAGLVLGPGAVTPAAVAAAAARLLAGPGFAAAADGLRREIAAMPGPDAVDWEALGATRAPRRAAAAAAGSARR